MSKRDPLKWFGFLSLVLTLGSGPLASASDDSVVLQDSPKVISQLDTPAAKPFGDLFLLPRAAVTPADLFARTLSVLEHLGVPTEPDSQPLVAHLDGRQNAAGMHSVLQYMDRNGTLARFVQSDASVVRAFQDRDSKQVEDFTVRLAPWEPQAPIDNFHQRLLNARFNPSHLPLLGLRIAIDPGHMGGELWDQRTGKYVTDRRGKKLSEGVMALQVALMMEERLESLGAQVTLTRRGMRPVTSRTLEELELRPYALSELKEITLTDWFQALLARGAAGSQQLFNAFDSSSDIRRILAESEPNRHKYFVLREDLKARSDILNGSDADIALVIHFDTSDPPNDPNGLNPRGHNGAKVYVVGNVEPVEMSSREARVGTVRHLLDATTWNASLNLGRSVVKHLAQDLSIGFDTGGGMNAHRIEPGVLARNLGVNRRVHNRPLSFVECLYYNDPREFERLSRMARSMTIDGVSYPYSDRLADVAKAIGDGVIEFVAGYGR